jgi:hypothetical protein
MGQDLIDVLRGKKKIVFVKKYAFNGGGGGIEGAENGITIALRRDIPFIFFVIILLHYVAVLLLKT